MKLHIQYDPDADAIFVSFRELPPESVAGAHPLDERRLIHYGTDGEVAGVEFLQVSSGVLLDGVPEGEAVGEALRAMAAVSVAA